MCHKVTCKFLDVNEGGDFTHKLQGQICRYLKSMLVYSMLIILNEPSLVLQPILTIQFLSSWDHQFFHICSAIAVSLAQRGKGAYKRDLLPLFNYKPPPPILVAKLIGKKGGGGVMSIVYSTLNQ